MPGQLRQGQHEPIVPPQGGDPPTWIVACLDCGFSHDAHGATPTAALQTIAPTHERRHRLRVRAVDYTQPIFGRTGDGPHPLYPR